MALLKCKEIMELASSEIDGFMEKEGDTVNAGAAYVQTSADAENTCDNPKNIANIFGNPAAWLSNADSVNPGIAAVCDRQLLTLYLSMASAPYEGMELEARLRTFDRDSPVENQCIRDLGRLRIHDRTTGLEKRADSILELRIGGQAAGIYYPKWMCFIPGAGFQGRSMTDSGLEEYIKKFPHAVKRCRALLTAVLSHGAEPAAADRKVIERALERIGGRLTDYEMRVFEGEESRELPEDVTDYIYAVSSDADPVVVCGCLGRNAPGRLLPSFAMINTGTAPVGNINPSFGRAGEGLTIIPPAAGVKKIEAAAYDLGPLNEDGVPEWMEFQARLDGVLYHKIYTCSRITCRPPHYIDLAYQVPDGILSQYSYLVQESAAPSAGLDDFEPKTEWKAYPEDSGTNVFRLSSLQYRSSGAWEVHLRTERIRSMELVEKDSGRVLGSVVLEQAPPFQSAGYNRYLPLDPAGAQSVRLVSDKGTGKAGALEYSNLIYPLTPMAEEEFALAVEQRTGAPVENRSHFASLIQSFRSEGVNGWAGLMAQNRIWKPDETDMYEALKASPGTKAEAMNKLGVISNMKEALTRPGLDPEERQNIILAMKNYIGIMLLEGVLALSKQGFSIRSGNLEILLSYPENGSGEGISRVMKEIIEGAADLVNVCLTKENQLHPGGNMKLYSESKASAKWHETNPPSESFLGGRAAVLTMDYGYSTHDLSLRVNNRLYTASVPYAARRITNETLAEVYGGDAEGMVRCFVGGDPAKKQQARETMEEAMKTGKAGGPGLCDCLGFDLTLNQLFNSCSFQVNGANADSRQKRVQQLTEVKLNAGIPAYADIIVRAIKDGCLETDREVFLAPVGKGSLAINNTAKGFEERFARRIRTEVNYLLKQNKALPEGTVFTGNITMLPNNDRDKRSVAEGMLDIRSSGEAGPESVSAGDLTSHYLDLVYGKDSQEAQESQNGREGQEGWQARQLFAAQLEELDGPAAKAARRRKLEGLYRNAFASLAGRYTLEQFEEAFSRFGYIGSEDGSTEEEERFDSEMQSIVRENFKNLRDQLMAEGRELVMSCPRIEEEMLCGAMLDLAVRRMK